MTKLKKSQKDYRIDEAVNIKNYEVTAEDILTVDNLDFGAMVKYGDFDTNTETYQIKLKNSETGEGKKHFKLKGDEKICRCLPVMAVHYGGAFDTEHPEREVPYAISVLVPIEEEERWELGCISILEKEEISEIFARHILPFKRRNKEKIEEAFMKEGPHTRAVISKGKDRCRFYDI